MNEASPLPPPAIKDRRTGLVVFGVIDILLACLCLLLIAAMGFGQAMLSRTTGQAMEIRLLLPSILFYLLVAGMLVSLGIGSIRCRRWARALTLILAWPWLCSGLFSIPMLAIMMPKAMAGSMPQGQQVPPGILKMILVVQIAFMTVFFILLPLLLVLFYGNSNVKATCELRDPVPRWTDRAPLPVLGTALWLSVGAVLIAIFAVAAHGVIPVFGRILSGPPGMAILLLAAGLWAVIARLWYRQKAIGWWLLLGTFVLAMVSNLVTFSRVDILELYRAMGYPEAQIDMIRRQGIFTPTFLISMSAVTLIPMLGYLLWTRRFFCEHPGGPEGAVQNA